MTIVYSYYVLDIVHKGHLSMMRNAKAMAGEDGKLIVGILTDECVMKQKGEKPVVSFEERMDLAASIKYADVVVAQSTYSPLTNLEEIKPDILMESTSHDKADVEEYRKYMESIGGRVVILPYYPSQSSTRIKNSIKGENG